MRMSRLFSQTLREAPAEAEAAGHQLLLRAGFIRQHAAGIFSYLPLARRAMNRIEEILRAEMDAIGGQEITMPAVQPAELWQASGRWYKIDAEMGRFKDRGERDMALAMTHEEVAADLARREIRSYRQLPLMIYQIQTKWRDDPRPRGGLVRAREFTMKDSYTFDASWENLDLQYRDHYQAYFNIFHRCGLPVISVAADMGMMGGKLAHEFMYLTPGGEDTLILCDSCGYAANRQAARARHAEPAAGQALPIEKVATPGCKTIAELARFLGIAEAQTAKAVLLAGTRAVDEGQPAAGETEQFIFAVVRGDMELNETKLANAAQARRLRPATEEEIRAAGAEPGYAAPVGLRGALVVVDELVTRTPNLVAGANEAGYHLLNVNYGRDYQAHIVADLSAARAGDGCPACGSALRAERGVEVGNIFQLGTHFSEALGATFLDAAGQAHPLVMGSYGIGIGRLLACVAEHCRDERGLRWPVTVAPYAAHLVRLAGKGSQETIRAADQLYARLSAAGLEPLYDDRDESPGVKFNDADLIGLPARLTVSERGLNAGTVEMKRRDSDEKTAVPLEEAVRRVEEELAAMQDAILDTVQPVPYK